MVLDIIKIGDPALRKVASEVDPDGIPTTKIQSFIDDLIATMRDANGAGLAATQVAVPWRIFVVEVNKNPRYPYKPDIPLTVVINPELEFLTEDRFSSYEGCLSVSDLRGVVDRCPEIRLRGLDRNGEPIDMIVRGITAGTFQHELDHLDGMVFVDRVRDTRTFCTWNEFKKHHEAGFRKQVEKIIARYGS